MTEKQRWGQLKANPEFQSAIIRLAIWAIAFYYLYRPDLLPLYQAIFAAYLAVYVLVLVSTMFIAFSTARRYSTLFIDIAGVSLLLYAQGHVITPLLLIYVWIYIGYGFRYGAHFLLVAAGSTLVGYVAAAFAISAWSRDFLSSSLALFVLALLPLYQYSLQRKLEHAKRDAESANRIKTEFLSTMSHELRTPLTTIVGMGQLLADTRLDHEQEEYLKSLRASAGVLRTHIQDVLDIARLGAHELVLELRPFVPERAVLEVARATAGTARDKGLALYVWISPGLPSSLEGDELRVRQVLRHLLDNAVKFTESGEVRLLAEWQAPSGEKDGRLVLRVQDTGVGIAPEKLEHIFDRFWQGDSSLGRRQRGFGLGTTMVKELVELMGGTVTVESRPGVGTVFETKIPFRAASTGEPAPPVDDLSGQVVVVDSGSQFEASLLVDYCHHAGCRVINATARDVAALETPPDAVLLSESGPLGFATRLAGYQELFGGSVPVIPVHSSTGSDESVSLQSPFCANDLNRVLHDVLVSSSPTIPVYELAVADATAVPALAQTGEVNGIPAGDSVNTAPQDAAGQRPPQQDEGGDSGAGGAPRVLVVEDDPDIALLIQALLELKEYRVETTDDGFEALERLEKGGYDLVLMDLRMPRMDGQTLARTWRAREEASGRSRIPMVALTAETLDSVRRESFAAGMDDFLTKPVEPEAFYALLEQHLKARSDGA